MESGTRHELRNYFQQELDFLRLRAVEFSQDNPDIAEELELSQGKSSDPHIEALLQSFAFLTGRIQYNLEAESPKISNTLLSSLCPHLEVPIPSMAIAEFDVDPNGANFAGGVTLTRGRAITSQGQTASGDTRLCTFQNCYDTELWPMQVSEVQRLPSNHYSFLARRLDIQSALRVRIHNEGGDPITSYNLSSLRFYINGLETQQYPLYELLLHQAKAVVLRTDLSEQPVWFPASAIVGQGFESDQAVLPYTVFSHDGYRYLHEYFLFPQKFMFFDLKFDKPVVANRTMEFLFLFDQEFRLSGLSSDSLRLNCFPVVNLFSKTSTPIRLDHRHYEYRLIPDDHNYRYCEVHTVQEVYAKKPGQPRMRIEPMFQFEQSATHTAADYYWSARRELSQLKSLAGTEFWLSFHDMHLSLAVPPSETVYAKTLCTNRDLPERMAVGTVCKLDGVGPGSRTLLRTKPTPHRNPPIYGYQPWQLISHLSLNHLSLDENESSVSAFRELLKLYVGSDSPQLARQIACIRQLETQPMVTQIGQEAWRGFCRGREITVTIDEKNFEGGSPLLFGEVLSCFFALYSSLHSFTQLIIQREQQQGIWKRWPIKIGEQTLL